MGFVGFGGLSSPGGASLGYVPMATSSGDDVDNTVDGDFRMTMRKLMKRDGVTKIKVWNVFVFVLAVSVLLLLLHLAPSSLLLPASVINLRL